MRYLSLLLSGVFVVIFFGSCGGEASTPFIPQAEPVSETPVYSGDLSEVSQERADKMGCLSCHEGIEDIRDSKSAMMLTIKAFGSSHGDPGGCVVCHGGTPSATSIDTAHEGTPGALALGGGPKEFYPDPGSSWIFEQTCGQGACHPGYGYRMDRALMTTEAGKISGNLHTWGVEEVQNYKVPWGNYDIEDTDGSRPSV